MAARSEGDGAHACILVINCPVLNSRRRQILSPLDRADDEDGDEIPDKERSSAKPPGEGGAVTGGVLGAATSGGGGLLATVRLVDGCGAYAVVLTEPIVGTGECSLLNLALLKLVAPRSSCPCRITRSTRGTRRDGARCWGLRR